MANDEYNGEALFNDAARVLAGIRRSAPRRAPFVMLDMGSSSTSVNIEEPPAQRPRLERQDAFYIDNITITVSRRRTNVNALLALLNSLSSRPKMEYVLVVADIKPDWECSVCLEEEVNEGVVWHPSNCHTFHRKCLQKAMEFTVTCPLCRSHTTPLLMTVSNSNN
jgi:hypothetical protein